MNGSFRCFFFTLQLSALANNQAFSLSPILYCQGPIHSSYNGGCTKSCIDCVSYVQAANNKEKESQAAKDWDMVNESRDPPVAPSVGLTSEDLHMSTVPKRVVQLSDIIAVCFLPCCPSRFILLCQSGLLSQLIIYTTDVFYAFGYLKDSLQDAG